MKNLIEKLKYKFDNLMSKGTIGLIWILFLLTSGVIVLTGIVASLTNDESIVGNIWTSVMHTIDAGTITGTETANIGFLVIMCIVTLSGLFITSILIGIITTGFEERLNLLKKGNSKVIEKDHTLILGFDDSVYTIISELIIANENRKDACIVLLCDQDKEEVETAISEQIPDFKTTRIVCRTGSTTDTHMLKQCSIDKARSILITSQNDFITIKTILAINSLFKENNYLKKPYMITTIDDEDNYNVAQIASEGNAEILLAKDSISRIIAQTCRLPGLSNVLIELFDYDGNELYFENFPSLSGKTFIEALNLFENAVIFGFKRDDKIYINPPKDTVLDKDDYLVLLVEDDGLAKPLPTLPKFENIEAIKTDVSSIDTPENILILGINEKTPQILQELDNFFATNSNIYIAANRIPTEYKNINKYFKNVKLTIEECDINSRSVLNKLTEKEIDHVLLLSDDTIDSETSDSITLLRLIHLRDIALKQNKSFNITSELKETVNQKLAKVANVKDLVVGSNIINLMLTQISENRDLSAVFKLLLHVDGPEIHTRKVSHYLKTHDSLSFNAITKLVAEKDEIAIGYKKVQGDSFEIFVNPPKSKLIELDDNDELIVLAEE